MSIKDHARKLIHRRHKRLHLVQLPTEVLTKVCRYLPLRDKKSFRLAAAMLALAGGRDMWRNVKLDLAVCTGDNNSYEKPADYNEFICEQYEANTRPVCMVISTRKDVHDFSMYVMADRLGEYLSHSENLTVRVSARTFGFGYKMPQDIDQLDDATFHEQGMWLLEKGFARYCAPGIHLEVLTSALDGTAQLIAPIMKLIKAFPDAPKSLSSSGYVKLMNKDPIIDNVERYQVFTRAFGLNLSVPESVRRLDFRLEGVLKEPLRANAVSKFFNELRNLQVLTLDGFTVNCCHEDHWIPESVHTLELFYDHTINRSHVTFPHIKTLKLHMVGEHANNPFKLMRFPNVQSLFIREKPTKTRGFIKLPATLTAVREVQCDVQDLSYTYLVRLLSRFNSHQIEKLVLSGTFRCQEFMHEKTGQMISDNIRQCLPRLRNLKCLVLNSGVETHANMAIVRAFVELPRINQVIVYPATNWQDSQLGDVLSPAVVELGCQNAESQAHRTAYGFYISVPQAKKLKDSDWAPRIIASSVDRQSDDDCITGSPRREYMTIQPGNFNTQMFTPSTPPKTRDRRPSFL